MSKITNDVLTRSGTELYGTIWQQRRQRVKLVLYFITFISTTCRPMVNIKSFVCDVTSIYPRVSVRLLFVWGLSCVWRVQLLRLRPTTDVMMTSVSGDVIERRSRPRSTWCWPPPPGVSRRVGLSSPPTHCQSTATPQHHNQQYITNRLVNTCTGKVDHRQITDTRRLHANRLHGGPSTTVELHHSTPHRGTQSFHVAPRCIHGHGLGLQPGRSFHQPGRLQHFRSRGTSKR